MPAISVFFGWFFFPFWRKCALLQGRETPREVRGLHRIRLLPQHRGTRGGAAAAA